MKKMNLIMAMLISVALVFTSCTKDTDLTPDAATDGMGSYSMTLDGNTFSGLNDPINMVLNTVLIPGKDHNSMDFTFTIFFTPAVGETVNICHEECPDNSLTLLYMSEAGAFTGWDGTVHRVSDKKIELNGNLFGVDGELHPFSLTINLNIIV